MEIKIFLVVFVNNCNPKRAQDYYFALLCISYQADAGCEFLNNENAIIF